MPYVAVVDREYAEAGRKRDKTYVNVVTGMRAFNTGESLAFWLTNNPAHPWNDAGYAEFVVEITQQEYQDYVNGLFPLFYGEDNNLITQPQWQQQTDGSGSTTALGSFADPEDDQSVFTVDVALADDRWIVRIYDDDPVVNPGTANQLDEEELDQDTVTPTRTRYLRLYTPADVASSTNLQNQRTDIGGRMMDFDFTDGVATFEIEVHTSGQGDFPSNHAYRLYRPGDVEGAYSFKVFGKNIGVAPE